MTLVAEPGHPFQHAIGQKADVETVFPGPHVDTLLLVCEQIYQQSPKSGFFEDLGRIPVARAVSAAAASVRKDDQPAARRTRSIGSEGAVPRERDRDLCDDLLPRSFEGSRSKSSDRV